MARLRCRPMTDDTGAVSPVAAVATVLVVAVAGFAGWAWFNGSVGPLPIRRTPDI